MRRSRTVLLDVGCGNGHFDLKLAELFHPERIILTDIADSLAVQLPVNAEFPKSRCLFGSEFFVKFRHTAQLVVCIAVIHEAPNIVSAVTNLFAFCQQVRHSHC